MPPMANGGMQRGCTVAPKARITRLSHRAVRFRFVQRFGHGHRGVVLRLRAGRGDLVVGRAPASNNALCAYTPSRGMISTRGGWPLVPTMDVVVPHARTMADLLEVLDVVVAPDPDKRGDFWRASRGSRCLARVRCVPRRIAALRTVNRERSHCACRQAVRCAAHVHQRRSRMLGPLSGGHRASAVRRASGSDPSSVIDLFKAARQDLKLPAPSHGSRFSGGDQLRR